MIYGMLPIAHNADMKGILVHAGYSLSDAVNDVLERKAMDYEVDNG